MVLWLNIIFAALALGYLFTLLFGMLGNCWVVASVLRTSSKKAVGGSAPCGMPSFSPSNRLRKYIWLLALLDLLVSGSLLFRVWSLLVPGQPLSDFQCQVNFASEQLFKLCSLTCLACISIERFITIRKPFNNKVRKLAVRLTPLFAFLSIGLCGGAVLWLAVNSVRATPDGANCTQQSQEEAEEKLVDWMAQWALSAGFCAQLAVIGANYVRIVHHVRRKFWQRKARAVANSFSQTARPNMGQSLSGESQQRIAATARLLVKKASPPLLVVAEPRYMRQMTTAIMRIAVFHLLCWLPFCLLQVAPSMQSVFPSLDLESLRVRSATAIRMDPLDQSSWLAFGANWLTYANSAGNWVLYAALNRDLRSIIKACSERRRKRSTLSQQQHQQSPNGGNNNNTLRRSVRRNAFNTLRLFYSLNSHRSSASVDLENNSAATILAAPGLCCPSHQQQQLENGANSASSLRAPCSAECGANGADLMRKHSAQSANGGEQRRQPTELGVFGWRQGRAHTFCTPREQQQPQVASDQQSTAAATQQAHLCIMHQIMAAVHNTTGAASQPPRHRQARKGSAAERRELFAQMHTPLPPIQIVSIADE